jgi:type III pantothenate kinase
MILAVTIGNTSTRFALSRGGRLRRPRRIDTPRQGAPTVIRSAIASFLAKERIRTGAIDGAVLSCVVPALTVPFRSELKRQLHLSPLVIRSGPDLGILICYDRPGSLGSDRLCAAVAAFEKHGGPAIVIDFGTATTYNIVSRKGEFLGGLIAPGIAGAAASLHTGTAKLPAIRPAAPAQPIGTSTAAGMQAGVFYTMVYGMEGIVRRIRGIIGEHALVIATGGTAALMAEHSRLIDHVEPDLVLEGAVRIYERVRGEGRPGVTGGR